MIEERIILQVLAEQRDEILGYDPSKWVSRKEESLFEFNSFLAQVVIGVWVKGLDRTETLKRFLRMFVVMPAKWIKSGRRNVLNLYTKRRIYLELVR